MTTARHQLADEILAFLTPRSETFSPDLVRKLIHEAEWAENIFGIRINVPDEQREEGLMILARYGVDHPEESTLEVLAQNASMIPPRVFDHIANCSRAHSQAEANAIYRIALITQNEELIEHMNARGVLPNDEVLAPGNGGAWIIPDAAFLARCQREWESIRTRNVLRSMGPCTDTAPAVAGL